MARFAFPCLLRPALRNCFSCSSSCKGSLFSAEMQGVVWYLWCPCQCNLVAEQGAGYSFTITHNMCELVQGKSNGDMFQTSCTDLINESLQLLRRRLNPKWKKVTWYLWFFLNVPSKLFLQHCPLLLFCLKIYGTKFKLLHDNFSLRSWCHHRAALKVLCAWAWVI